MAQGQFRLGNEWADVGEHGPEVMRPGDTPAMGSCLLQDRTVGEHVARGDQSKPATGRVCRTIGPLGPAGAGRAGTGRAGAARGESLGTWRIPGTAGEQRADKQDEQDSEASEYEATAPGKGAIGAANTPPARRAIFARDLRYPRSPPADFAHLGYAGLS
jgi:hypothetical protein